MDEIMPLITAPNAMQCSRPSCQIQIRANEPYQTIRPRDANGNILGISIVCLACFKHYENKQGTLRRTIPVDDQVGFRLPVPTPPLINDICQQNIDASRIVYQGGKSPVQAVGLQLQNPYANIAPATTELSTQPLGYNPNHASYGQHRDMVKKLAAGGRGEVVFVNTSIRYLLEGQSKPKQLGMTSETLKNVPVHLKPDALKDWVMKGLATHIWRDTKEYPYSKDDFTLCGPGNVQLERYPEDPPLYDQCFKMVTKHGVTNRVFNPGQRGEVFLLIKPEIYPVYRRWIDEALDGIPRGQRTARAHIEAEAMVSQPNFATGPIPPVPEWGGSVDAGRMSLLNVKHPLVDEDGPTRPSKRVTPMNEESLGRDAVGDALRRSELKKVSGSNGTMISARGIFLPVVPLPWRELVKGSGRLELDYETNGCEAILRIQEDKHQLLDKPGAFKTAELASITLLEIPKQWDELHDHPTEHPILVSRRTPIVLKRHFIRKQRGGPRLTPSKEIESAFLEGEANVAFYAASLHQLPYDHMRAYLDQHPDSVASKLQIPETRMVHVELATGPTLVVTSKGKQKSWVKYISNASPVPLVKDGPARDVADFLSYCQHAQWDKTDGQAIVSDYQVVVLSKSLGSFTMLSDPQILTHPDLGQIFADGNIGSLFEEFPLLHKCNKFCIAFDLKPLRGSSNDQPIVVSDEESTPSSTPLPSLATHKKNLLDSLKRTKNLVVTPAETDEHLPAVHEENDQPMPSAAELKPLRRSSRTRKPKQKSYM
ncbi:hypothetical protein CALCODRAFT_505754 [Calocera cornea HHB12733]|uniref:Alpha-type protein kinase domain-containing protein n=1 Tax=Calocera cornea HHB12733 TaxID=1353952 RepID=A0A165JRJ5_9BASI|nr:hypothetical protein CALCODRAFT_505754 [Calocera cornea HHB12733]